MKTTFFSILIFLLCLANVGYSQSVTLTGFNGKIEFKSFVTNGANIRGTLINFIDQTNQYTAANIAVNDIAWDNQGRRYKVVTVVSSTSIQAVVDLSRVGGGTHFPRGLGFISRETENGLSLFTAANTLGMSTALLSRVLNHNMSRIDSVFKRASLSNNIYNANGTIPSELSRTINLGTGASMTLHTFSFLKGINLSSNVSGSTANFINNALSTNTVNTANGGFIIRNGRNLTLKNEATLNFTPTQIDGYLLGSISLPGIRKYTSSILGIDSTRKFQSGGFNVKFDSLATGGRSHFGGFVKGYIQNLASLGQGYSINQAFTIQTLFTGNPPPKFDWLKIDQLDTDTTSNRITFYNNKYSFTNTRPTSTSGAISEHVWVAGLPAFIQSKNGLATGTTDGSGDLTVTIPAMPDNTYSVLLTVSGTTNYQVSAHTLTTTTFKVRCSNGSAQSVSIFYEVKDY
jgi:hypothetical protein